MLFNKRGVSPLIAAVLLIVVVVGVGAVVTGIVRNYVTSGKQTIQSKSGDIKCGAEVDISVPTVANAIRICVDEAGATLNFTMDITGSANIDGLQVKMFSASSVWSNDTVYPLDPAVPGTYLTTPVVTSGATVTYSVPLPAAFDTAAEIAEAQIVPRIQVVGRADLAYCVDSALKFTPQAC